MKPFFERAIENIIQYGDTDIFPFPMENYLFRDKKEETLKLLLEIHADFDKYLTTYPPANEGALAPVSYTGFRWATQLDPLWNAYFLGLVLSISDQIEAARLSTALDTVFSYRFSWNSETAELFRPEYGWRKFMEHSLTLAKEHQFVVTCDISEFYPRLGHHKLDNALRQLALGNDVPHRIMEFLSYFSDTKSFGIPVGGPAARILSELVLNQIDRLLRFEQIKFCRFADDYHLFCATQESAYTSLIFLSEKLLTNQGLQLQKSKTRIMSSAEFISTNPVKVDDHHDAMDGADPASLHERARGLLGFSLRFDPYSSTAEKDYESLRREIEKFDILSLLKMELSKSRIHIALGRKIISAIKYLGQKDKEGAILSLLDNAELLYPVFSTVMLVAKAVLKDLAPDVQNDIGASVRNMIERDSHVLRVELNLAYAIRLLADIYSAETEELLVRIYKRTTSALLRRDIVLAMARWKAHYWLSDLLTNFRAMSPAERRAFIVASYYLSDEGRHWRDHIGDELSPFERLVQQWASGRVNLPSWRIPL